MKSNCNRVFFRHLRTYRTILRYARLYSEVQNRKVIYIIRIERSFLELLEQKSNRRVMRLITQENTERVSSRIDLKNSWTLSVVTNLGVIWGHCKDKSSSVGEDS